MIVAVAEQLGAGTFQIDHLPARVVYLVPAGDRSAFRHAVQEACTRWGGATEPIVPVRRSGQIDASWRQIVSYAAVDCAVSVELDDVRGEAAAARLGLPLVRHRDIDHASPSMWSTHPAALLPVTTGRAVPGAGGQAVCATPSAPLWAAVAAGEPPEGRAEEYARAAVSVVPTASPDVLARSQFGETNLVALTTTFVSENFSTNQLAPSPVVVWLTRRDSLRDCTYFWNLRALRSLGFDPSPWILMPEDGIEEWLHLDEQVASLLRRPEDLSPDVVITTLTVPQERLTEFADRLGLQRSLEGVRIRRRFPPPPMREPPFTYRSDVDPRAWTHFERRYGVAATAVAQLSRTRTIVDWESPIDAPGPGYCLLRLSGEALVALPKRRSVAAMVHPDGRWAGHLLELSTTLSDRYRIELRLPDLPEVADVILRESAPTARLSDKGKLALAVAGLAPLEGLLANGVYETLRALTTPRSTEIYRQLKRMGSVTASDRETAALAAQLGGRRERQFANATQVRERAGLDAREALESLVGYGLAERGLHLPCRTCGLSSFVALETVDGAARCPGCRAQGAFESGPAGLEVHYRLNTLLDRASDQGAIPHLLAWAALEGPHTYFLPGVELTDEATAEVDLIGIVNGRVVAGEVKTSASAFTEVQIRRDVELSARLGADDHLLAAVDEVSAATRAFVERATRNAGLGLIVLDRAQMRP